MLRVFEHGDHEFEVTTEGGISELTMLFAGSAKRIGIGWAALTPCSGIVCSMPLNVGRDVSAYAAARARRRLKRWMRSPRATTRLLPV